MTKMIENTYKLDLEKIEILDNKSHNPNCNIISYHINNDENITFCNKLDDYNQLVEYYKGFNYNVNSKLRSYSKVYKLENTPKQYKDIVNSLIRFYNFCYKTNFKGI